MTQSRTSQNITAGRKFRRGTIPGFRDILNASQYIRGKSTHLQRLLIKTTYFRQREILQGS